MMNALHPNIVMFVAYGTPVYFGNPQGTTTQRTAIGKDASGQLWQFQTKTFTDNRGMKTTYAPENYQKIFSLPPRNAPNWWFNPHYEATESATDAD